GRLHAEQKDQHRRHQRSAAGTRHPDEEADDRAAEDDVGIDVQLGPPWGPALVTQPHRRAPLGRSRPRWNTAEMARNVLGGELEPCSSDPLTGFYRDGCCN